MYKIECSVMLSPIHFSNILYKLCKLQPLPLLQLPDFSNIGLRKKRFSLGFSDYFGLILKPVQ